MRKLLLILLVGALLAVVVIYFFPSRVDLPEDVKQAYSTLPASLDYNMDVKPILADKCFACHGPDKNKQQASLRLDIEKFAYAELPENKGKVAIKPGNLQESELFHRIISTDPKYMMPAPESHHTLTAIEKAILIKWIKDGAVYKPHWAFVKPMKPKIPAIDEKGWNVRNPIDNFILARLAQKKMHPSPEADKQLLLRRLFLDLTGLPPTLAEIDDFLKDNSANAYERQVDRLLKSEHFGEKMAVDWLDVARFADSHGYTVDRLRDMSPYRDWVIHAFNANLPYDKFLLWQLAGDLVPNPTKETIIATAFNRNHQQNMEGGIIEEEFQTEYVVDRTNTFGTAVMGLSVGCAKCHDHKFDPISQKNYYQLYSFFNNVKEAGQISWDDATPSPTLMLPTKEKEAVLTLLKNGISKQEQALNATKNEAGTAFNNWLNSGAYKKLGSEKIPDNGLQAYYVFNNSLASSVNNKELPSMKREAGLKGDKPVFVDGMSGKALQFDGDTWLDLGQDRRFQQIGTL
jgi:cytochrome c553